MGNGTVTIAQGGTIGTSDIAINGSNLTIGGTIQDGTATKLRKQQAGALTLAGSNTLTGGVILQTGTLNINNAGALGSGTFVYEGGAFDNTSGSAITLSSNNTQTWSNNPVFTGSNDLDMGTGAVNAGLSRNVTVNGSKLSLGGISSTGFINKLGVGTLAVNGASSYTGTTTVSAGTLLVNSSHTGGAAYSVSNGGTLGGAGSITTASSASVTVNSGGKLAAGSSAGLAGTLAMTLGTGALDVSGAVGGANTGALLFDLAATGASDKISLVSGSLSIGSGALNWNDFTFATLGGFDNGVYTLFDTSSAITGTLGSTLSGSIGTGGTGVLSFANANNDLILTVTGVVPEPSTFALALISCGFALAVWTRKRRAASHS